MENILEIYILEYTEVSVAQGFRQAAGIFADPLNAITRRAIEMVGGRVMAVEIESVAQTSNGD